MTPGERRLHEEILNLRAEYELTRPFRFKNRLGRRRFTPPPPAHGTRKQYGRGCRCQPCRIAMRSYMEGYRAGKMGL